MLFVLVFGMVLLLPGVFCLLLAVQSRNPLNLVSTTGELTKKVGYKNYRLKKGTVPNAAEYTYTYTVNGKPYSLRGVQLTHVRNLRKRVPVVYLRSFPRCAYVEQFSGIAEWLLAISLIAVGALLVTIYFSVT